MNQLFKIFIIVLLTFSMVTSCVSNHQEAKVVEGNPNVILLIGDGMGLSQVSAAYYYGKNEPNFNRFKEIGLINTSSVKHKITDSGAAATALACGEKTYNGVIGLDKDSTEIPNLVEELSLIGFSTGVISTSSITHATPAGFYSHVWNRGMQYEIAEQLVNSELDFFAGGGTKWFMDREDGKLLIPELEKNNFLINSDITASTLDPNYKYAYLLAKDGMPSMLDDRGAFLPDYTKLALDYFTKRGGSFFLMVEGSQIDWAAHDNNSDYMIAEVLDFDKTVGVVMDYAELKGNTLVIVLADHETGGFALGTNDGDYSTIKPVFATYGHSTTLVPVFAYGPGAENFKGVYDNNDIFHKILSLTGN